MAQEPGGPAVAGLPVLGIRGSATGGLLGVAATPCDGDGKEAGAGRWWTRWCVGRDVEAEARTTHQAPKPRPPLAREETGAQAGGRGGGHTCHLL